MDILYVFKKLFFKKHEPNMDNIVGVFFFSKGPTTTNDVYSNVRIETLNFKCLYITKDIKDTGKMWDDFLICCSVSREVLIP